MCCETSQAGLHRMIKYLFDLFSKFAWRVTKYRVKGVRNLHECNLGIPKDLGCHKRLASSYYPMSIGRGKVAVKKATRLLRSNIDTPGILKMMDLWMQCFIPEIHPTTIVKYLRSRLYLASIWRQFFVFELFVKSSLILRCGSCGEKRISWKKRWFVHNLQEESYNHFTLVVDAW